MASVVAIVGLPNVGKSTLFNRLVEGREAIMSSESGTTRDRHEGYGVWNGKEFIVVDTGGYIQGSEDTFEKEVCNQARIAIEEADIVLMVLDCQVGITAMDQELVSILRQASKPVLLVVNKVDNPTRMLDMYQFHALGMGELYPISASSGAGTGDLLDKVVSYCQDPVVNHSNLPRVAIIGRPNVGKSSFLNALLGQERNIVTPIPGTTRDAIDTVYNLYGKQFILTDTAGIRKKTKVKENIEFYAVLRSISALQAADVCLIMLDAQYGLETQDMSLINLAYRYKKCILLLVNKWDLVEKDNQTHDQYKRAIQKKLGDLRHLPVLFISALKKQRIYQVVEKALEIYDCRNQKLATSVLNQVLLPLVERYPPPAVRGKYIKIKYIARLPTDVPTIGFFCNWPQYILPAYKRYLENQIRKNFNLVGVPVQLVFRKK